MFGGRLSDNSFSNETWVYNLTANVWTLLSPVGGIKPSARDSHTMVNIGGDQVLLFGGWLNNETWVYDLSANTWTQMNPVGGIKPSARSHHAMAYIGSDQALLFGGGGEYSNDETWVYDLSANTWTQMNPVGGVKPSARFSSAMANIGGDRVLLFGGNDSAENDETWIYDLSANIWTLRNPVGGTKPSARSDLAMANIGGDQVILFGGGFGIWSDQTWMYDLSANTWAQMNPVGGVKPSARAGHAMANIVGDQVLLFGGWYGTYDGETWMYDLSANTWVQKSPTNKLSARSHDAMANIGGDQVLMLSGGTEYNETWLYDLSANTWTLKNLVGGPNPLLRQNHAMASIGGDQVLLFGGNDGAYDNETWVYDLSANTWTLMNPMSGIKPSPRYTHAMANIGGDQVLLFGGIDDAYDNETWVYDLSANTWTLMSPLGGTMPSARMMHEIAYLGGDQVLLFGGYDGAMDNETWVYDLSANIWTLWNPVGGTKPSARYAFAMANIGSNQVLLFGGWDGSDDDETWLAGGDRIYLPLVKR